MDKELKCPFMEAIRLGKGQGLADKTSQALTQGVEPALDMVGLSTMLSDGLMPLWIEDVAVGLPKIAKRTAAHVRGRNPPPQLQTTGFAAIADKVSDNLPGTATQRHPNPTFIGLLEDK